MSKSDTKQTGLERDEKGRIIGGTPPAGFNVHPENRHNGAWKKEDTARFKLEQMMKMSGEQLRDIEADETAPLFEQKLASCVRKGEWREIKEMIEQVYGKPKESVDMTTNGESMNPTVRIIDERPTDTK